VKCKSKGNSKSFERKVREVRARSFAKEKQATAKATADPYGMTNKKRQTKKDKQKKTNKKRQTKKDKQKRQTKKTNKKDKQKG
jgi:hypothetical protein